ncbi:hypothetical protein CP8484711_1349A, partial [Chlamydia psittaci 84-8471/1]|jgi:small nuclear ribonucleoprotein (snRNP)-like protein
MSFT